MPSLLTKVRTKLSIYAHRKVTGLLEGEYGSVFKGRSMDFDDLREYVLGDDIKDIDWKASARSGQMRIRRYVAIRKHNILLLVDTGRNMAATSGSGESKKDIVIMIGGVLGYIALKHGDLVALAAGDHARTQYVPLKGTEQHLESILQTVDGLIDIESRPSSIVTQLEYVVRTIRRRMIVVVITDDVVIDDEMQSVLRRLRVQHEVMWVTVGDADMTGDRDIAEVTDNETVLPWALRRDAKLADLYHASIIAERTEVERQLSSLGIACTSVSSQADVPAQLFRLLERQRYAKRR